MIVIFCTKMASASSCLRHFLCVSPWGWPCGRSIATHEPSSFTSCFPHSISCALRPRSSIPALCGPSFPRASSPPSLDDLDGIFKAIKDNALLSKYAGGLGNDWSSVRGLGAHIRGTNGQSQGVVPFLKVANDTAIAVNQGGKRKGAVCGYLETWHIDIEEFLDLRKNTGDDRRRTHDMNIANWVPDLFMERVEQDANWTLFSPDEVPDLHDLYGMVLR